MKVAKVTSKGQITIPQEARDALGIGRGTYLEVIAGGEEIKLRKVISSRALGGDDPIWALIGAGRGSGTGRGGTPDVSEDHDRHLAEGEVAGWRRSS
ncbi:MAG: transcriptional regulator, AbrB family [Myxococcales bacterium]|nr:transcriptional regulator, AbrB family [Myxococcales bacterium]